MRAPNAWLGPSPKRSAHAIARLVAPDDAMAPLPVRRERPALISSLGAQPISRTHGAAWPQMRQRSAASDRHGANGELGAISLRSLATLPIGVLPTRQGFRIGAARTLRTPG